MTGWSSGAGNSSCKALINLDESSSADFSNYTRRNAGDSWDITPSYSGVKTWYLRKAID